MPAMAKYASALSQHPVAAHAVGEAAGEILEAFEGEDPDLVVCFVSPHFVGAFDDFAFALGNLLDPSILIGATAVAIIGGAHEVEEGPAVSLFAACMPDAQLTPVSLSLEDTPDGQAITGWPELDHDPGTLVLLTDPYSFPTDGFLRQLDELRPGLQVIGGAASAAHGPGGNRLVLDDQRRRNRCGGRVDRRRRCDHGGVARVPSARPSLCGDPRGTQSRRRACRATRVVSAPGLRDGGERRRPRADPSWSARRSRRRRAQGRVRTRRLPRTQCGRRRPRIGRARDRRRSERRPDRAVPRARRRRCRRGPAYACSPGTTRVARCCSRATDAGSTSSACPTTTPASSTGSSARFRSPVRCAPARSAPWVAGTSCTDSPPASPCSAADHHACLTCPSRSRRELVN